jgi:hypothetical protein
MIRKGRGESYCRVGGHIQLPWIHISKISLSSSGLVARPVDILPAEMGISGVRRYHYSPIGIGLSVYPHFRLDRSPRWPVPAFRQWLSRE